MGQHYDRMLAAALDATGRKYRAWIIGWEITRKVAPYAAAVLTLGGLGFLAYWAWQRWAAPLFTADPTPAPAADPVAVDTGSPVPVWVWVSGLAVVVIAGWLFRPGRIPLNPRTRIVQAACLLFAFTGLVGVALHGITTH